MGWCCGVVVSIDVLHHVLSSLHVPYVYHDGVCIHRVCIVYEGMHTCMEGSSSVLRYVTGGGPLL